MRAPSGFWIMPGTSEYPYLQFQQNFNFRHGLPVPLERSVSNFDNLGITVLFAQGMPRLFASLLIVKLASHQWITK